MIEVEKDGTGLWIVTLNRPEKANALTADMLAELISVMVDAQEARGVILTGRGKVFSAGADLAAARAGLAVSPLWEELSAAVAAVPGLTVAALNGTLAGGANGMALACDLRIAVPTAKVFYPVMKLGYLPQPSDVVRMKALIGSARTKMILAAGQKITADEAYSWGLVDRIVEPERLLDEAKSLMADVTAADPAIAHQILNSCH